MPGIGTVVLSWCFVAQHQTDTNTLHARHLDYKLPVPTPTDTYLHIPAGSCFQPPSQASPPARADRQPPLLPSSASELPVNRPIRLFFSGGLVKRIHTSARLLNSLFSFWDHLIVGRRQLPVRFLPRPQDEGRWFREVTKEDEGAIW